MPLPSGAVRSPSRSAPDEGRQLAGSGQVAAGHRVVVVDAGTRRPCAQDRVGEIWVSGPSIALRLLEATQGDRESLSRDA